MKRWSQRWVPCCSSGSDSLLRCYFYTSLKIQHEERLLDYINIRNLISNQTAHNFLISSDYTQSLGKRKKKGGKRKKKKRRKNIKIFSAPFPHPNSLAKAQSHRSSRAGAAQVPPRTCPLSPRLGSQLVTPGKGLMEKTPRELELLAGMQRTLLHGLASRPTC